MQTAGIKSYYDVVVIGSGVGGLTAAALLSKAGLSVGVLEKEPHAGGYLAGFQRKNFRFDTAIHWLNQCAPGGMVCKIFDALGADHPVPVIQQRIRRYKGDSFDYLLTNNPDQMRDRLIAEFPHEAEGIRRFFAAAKKIGAALYNYGLVFRSEETMNGWERIKSKWQLLRFILPFIPHVRYSGAKGMKKGLNRFFKDERIHQIFASDTELLSCLIPIGWAYYSDFQSPPKGGGQVIPEWLQHVIEHYKGELHFKCEVNEILLEGGKCTGVALNQRGHTHKINSKYVIAANDVGTLYEKMLPASAVPDKLKDSLRCAELYSSSLTVSIALDCPAEQLGFNEELVHLASENIAKGSHTTGDPAMSEISILAPSMRDKTLAPEGKGTLTIYMPALMNYKNEWGTGKDTAGNYVRNETYNSIKSDIAEQLIARVEEKIAPGLKSHILFYEVATPVTHWRYTGNKNGTIMGAKPGRANMMAKVAHYQTPVPHLILGGHWAELGGGVPIAVKAGTNAALLVLKKENKKAFDKLAAYTDGKITLQQLHTEACFKTYHNNWVQQPTPAQKILLRTAAI